MSAHSAGPWRWEDWADANSTLRLRDANGSSVLRIHNDAHSREPTTPDARLIAAAPELLHDVALFVEGFVPSDEERERILALLRRIEGTP